MALYEDIYHTFRENIKQGVYSPGERLPSIRETAEKFNCNKITVQKAFERLKNEGLIDNQVGRGSFVCFPDTPAGQQHVGFPFHSAYICDDLFPADQAFELFDQMFREEGHLFDTGPMEGDSELVEALSSRYKVDHERTIIISGAQQGLNLCRTLYNLNISEHMLFEDPTYSGAISIFRPKHFVELEPDGPDLNRLKQLMKGKARFFYTIPQVHNPTGISYSKGKMDEIARLAEEHNVFIIEDDYLSEFADHPGERFIDRIPHRTIYIKSLSKVTAPGIRLGFMTVPGAMYQDFIRGKFSADLGTSLLMQRFFVRFISSGLLDRHLQKCRTLLGSRKKTIESVIGKYPFLRIPAQQSGYNIWIESSIPLPGEHVPWAKGEHFSFSSRWTDSFRLSLLGMGDRDFQNGASYLDSLFQSCSRNSSRPVL